MASHDDVVARVKSGQGLRAAVREGLRRSESITMPRIAQAIAAYERTVVLGQQPLRPLPGRRQERDERRAAARHGALHRQRRTARPATSASTSPTRATTTSASAWTSRSPTSVATWSPSATRTRAPSRRRPCATSSLTAPVHARRQRGARSRRWSSSTTAAACANPWLSKDMKPLGLSPQEKRDLVAFLEALTGPIANAEPPAALPQ